MDEIQKYYDYPALNQSFLKSLIGGVHNMYKNVESKVRSLKQGNALVIGSAVDCLVTDPDNWDHYYVIQSKLPPPQYIKVAELAAYIMHEKGLGLFMDIPPEHVLEKVCATLNYKTKDETIINNFLDKYLGFYKELIDNYDKTWLSQKDYELIDSLASNVMHHEHTKDLFDNDLEKLYQLAIYFEYKGVECKALLDILHIDHENKLIIPYDLKTTIEYPSNFPRAIDKYRYDIQARWYTLAVESEFASLISEGYVVRPFTFVVASKKVPQCPIKVPLNIMNPEKLDAELDDLIEKYKFYEENGYEYDINIAKNNGVLTVNKYY